MKDIGEVLLEKYLSEVITGTNESLAKVPNKTEDITAAVEVVSGLHQRFGEKFTLRLLELYMFNFVNPPDDAEGEKEELARTNRLKSNIRLFTELYLVNVFSNFDSISKDNLPKFMAKSTSSAFLCVLKTTLSYKYKYGARLSIATLFAKKYAGFFSEHSSLDRYIREPSLKEALWALFKAMTEAVFKRTVELDKKMKKLQKEHQRAQIRTGKLVDEYIEEYNKIEPVFERFVSAAQSLGESLNLTAPELSSSDDESGVNENKSIITTQVKSSNEKLWDSEETRKFYEVLPSVTQLVKEPITADGNEQTAAALKQFFIDLELCDNKEGIDELSCRYWLESLDNKATRKRLIKFFIEQQDWSKLKLYARFIATNAETMKDVKEELIECLDNGFRSQLHTNRINVKNIIFFCEMVKFNLVPGFLIFHKIRTLIFNLLVPNNIEILTVLFENFGRFLINKPEFSPQMEKMLELLSEKKKDHRLSVTSKNALENLLLLICPPTLSSLNVEAKVLTKEQQFYRILIRKELFDIGSKKASRLLKKANWRDPAVYKTMFSLFTKPEKVAYQAIPLLAQCLVAIYPTYRDFVIICIDTLLENIQRDLEINGQSHYMKRIAQIHYLTNIYNCGMIRSEAILDTAYQLLKYGYPKGLPMVGVLNEDDPADNYFRIHLIACILTGLKKTTPNLQKKLPLFMRFFEYYIYCKELPLPKQTEFAVNDVFNKFTTSDNFERAANANESARKLTATLQSMGLKATEEEEDEDSGYESSSGDSADSSEVEEEDVNSNLSEEDNDEDDDDSDSPSSSESEEDTDDDTDVFTIDRDLERKKINEEYERKLKSEEERRAEDEMEKMYQAVMQQSLESRKNEKIPMNNIPIVGSGTSTQVNSNLSSKVEAGKVPFTFLSKSGKRTQLRPICLPTDVKFVHDVLEGEQRLKSERERIKNIVLSQKFE